MSVEASRPEIEVRGLHKSFGTNEVLKGIDLEILILNDFIEFEKN